MRRAILITVDEEILNDVYSHELNPNCTYKIWCNDDGEWVAEVEEGVANDR